MNNNQNNKKSVLKKQIVFIVGLALLAICLLTAFLVLPKVFGKEGSY